MSIIKILSAAFLLSTAVIIEKNYLLKSLNAAELLIGSQIFGIVLVLIYAIFNRKFINNLVSKDKNTLILLILSFAFGLSAVYLFWDALKDNKAYYTVGFMKSAVILFVTIISILFYNEKITTAEICGILFIIIGIILLNSYKSN